MRDILILWVYSDLAKGSKSVILLLARLDVLQLPRLVILLHVDEDLRRQEAGKIWGKTSPSVRKKGETNSIAIYASLREEVMVGAQSV